MIPLDEEDVEYLLEGNTLVEICKPFIEDVCKNLLSEYWEQGLPEDVQREERRKFTKGVLQSEEFLKERKRAVLFVLATTLDIVKALLDGSRTVAFQLMNYFLRAKSMELVMNQEVYVDAEYKERVVTLFGIAFAQTGIDGFVANHRNGFDANFYQSYDEQVLLVSREDNIMWDFELKADYLENFMCPLLKTMTEHREEMPEWRQSQFDEWFMTIIKKHEFFVSKMQNTKGLDMVWDIKNKGLLFVINNVANLYFYDMSFGAIKEELEDQIPQNASNLYGEEAWQKKRLYKDVLNCIDPDKWDRADLVEEYISAVMVSILELQQTLPPDNKGGWMNKLAETTRRFLHKARKVYYTTDVHVLEDQVYDDLKNFVAGLNTFMTNVLEAIDNNGSFMETGSDSLNGIVQLDVRLRHLLLLALASKVSNIPTTGERSLEELCRSQLEMVFKRIAERHDVNSWSPASHTKFIKDISQTFYKSLEAVGQSFGAKKFHAITGILRINYNMFERLWYDTHVVLNPLFSEIDFPDRVLAARDILRSGIYITELEINMYSKIFGSPVYSIDVSQ
ncbi:MAG: hypothetical protein CMM02_07350 [Rhodopirellula sp.]|nr:hypothetical protein [Rhodopirellula sp.]